MASKKPPNQPDAAADARQRRRPPATIDLAATEVHVGSEESTTKAEPQAAPDLAQADPVPPADTASNPAPEQQAESGRNVPDIMEQPPMATFYDETRANASRAAQGGGAPPDDEPPFAESVQDDADAPRVPPAAAGFPWALAGAALGGGLFVALLLAGLFYAGALTPQPSVSADAALSARLARLEGQVAARTAAPTADRGASDAAMKDLAARLDKLESATARPPAPATDAAMAARVTALEAAAKSAGDGVAALNGRFADVNAAEKEMRQRDEALAASVTQLKDAVAQQQNGAGKDDLDKLAARMSALESATRAVEQKIETGSTAADRDVRFAVLASALKSAAERGAPFADELAGIRPLVNDTQALGQLELYAARGVPAAAALAGELTALVPAMERIANAPAAHDGTFLDKLQASAGRLVRIRPVGDAAGSDPAATVDRIENLATRADIDGALRELAKLPADVRAPAENWIAKAQRRQAALAAAQKISADALGALAKSAQQKAAQ